MRVDIAMAMQVFLTKPFAFLEKGQVCVCVCVCVSEVRFHNGGVNALIVVQILTQEVIKIWYIIFMTGIWFFRAVSGCLMWSGLAG